MRHTTMRSTSFAALLVAVFTSAMQAEPVHPKLAFPTDPDAVILTYSPDNGDLWVTQPAESTRSITTLEIKSQSEAIRWSACQFVFCGLFDIYSPSKLFMLRPEGFNEAHFEGAFEPGLTAEFLSQDLLVDGSMSGGGPLPEVVIPIPEPSTQLLAVFGLLMSGRVWNRRR